jgi:hypothetical protein
MAGQVKLAGLIATLLLIFLPSSTMAQDVNIGVTPSEVRISDLSPGQTTEFQLTVRNKDDINHIFAFSILQPSLDKRREGRAELPDDSWITFSSREIEVSANDEAIVTVNVTVPGKQAWANQDWETWLGVAPESSDLLGVELYVRLLISTNSVPQPRPNMWFLGGVGVATALLCYGGYYYFRRRARSE